MNDHPPEIQSSLRLFAEKMRLRPHDFMGNLLAAIDETAEKMGLDAQKLQHDVLNALEEKN